MTPDWREGFCFTFYVRVMCEYLRIFVFATFLLGVSFFRFSRCVVPGLGKDRQRCVLTPEAKPFSGFWEPSLEGGWELEAAPCSGAKLSAGSNFLFRIRFPLQ